MASNSPPPSSVSTPAQNTPPSQQGTSLPVPTPSSAPTPPINRPEDVPFHPNAFSLTRSHVSDFSKALARGAQNVAFRRKDEMVLSNHVKEAVEEIRKEPNKSRWSQFVIFLSSVILGISGQGFVAEITRFRTDPAAGDVTLTIIYGVVSIVMAVVATIALTR